MLSRFEAGVEFGVLVFLHGSIISAVILNFQWYLLNFVFKNATQFISGY